MEDNACNFEDSIMEEKNPTVQVQVVPANICSAENEGESNLLLEFVNAVLHQVQKDDELEENDQETTKAEDSSTQGSIQLVEPIQKTRSKSLCQPYVFYLTDELKKFTPNNFPKNNFIQIAGMLLYNPELKIICLEDISQQETINDAKPQIKLNLDYLDKQPLLNENYAVFGSLTFEEDETPMIVASFFQPLTVNYSDYIVLMLTLRNTMPLENHTVVSMNEVDVSGVSSQCPDISLGNQDESYSKLDMAMIVPDDDSKMDLDIN